MEANGGLMEANGGLLQCALAFLRCRAFLLASFRVRTVCFLSSCWTCGGGGGGGVRRMRGERHSVGGAGHSGDKGWHGC